MTFDEILAQTLDLLQHQGRVSYRALKRRFALDDDYLEDLKAELIDAQRVAADEDGKVLVWSSGSETAPGSDNNHKRAPLSYTPTHLVEKILNSREALEGERKQVTVLFADLKGLMELLADRDPEEARRLLDPVLELLIEAVHRYEGTVNQVLGDGIMALFGAPLAHEDHATRACYAAVWMQDAIGRYAEELRRRQGLDVQIRVGLNAGEVVVRSIGNDLHMVGLHMFYRQRAELQTSYEVGKQLLTLAQSVQDPQFLLEAHQALGTTLYFMGEFVQAREHLEQGVTLYDPQRHRSQAILYVQDPGVICLATLARALWALGYPNQALHLQRIHEALILARQLSHPFSLSFALYFAAVVYQYLQEEQATQEHAEALMALSIEQGFAQRLAQGRILLGWTMVEQGRVAAGIAQMRQSVAAYGATGADLGRSSYLALLAEAYRKGGQAEEGLAVLAEALGVLDEHDIRFNEAELYRLKGELLLRQLAARGSWLVDSTEPFKLPEVEHPVLTEAETCFRQALDTASRQGAKSLELRAAISLSRLWQRQGKSTAARDLLAGIHGWFTQGFDTVDLQGAKALLETLG